MTRQRGVALLIVISLLTVIGILGVAFAFSMVLETQASRHYVAIGQARYAAEAGISHARALLDGDRLVSRVDAEDETWTTAFAGSDTDPEGSGNASARWWTMQDAKARPAGRYAVAVDDEAGKLNVNTAYPAAAMPAIGAPNVTGLLQQIGINDPAQAAAAMLAYRHGPDGGPGVAGVDDDRDGVIDEPDEYQPLALRGDDRAFEALEEAAAVIGLDKTLLRRLAHDATVHSRDLNVSTSGQPRVNVNSATPEELLSLLLDAGVDDPWQAAVNVADYVDRDFEMSRLIKASQLLTMTAQGTQGGWEWRESPVGHYATEQPSETGLLWSVSAPAGTYRVIARGLAGIKVGDVTLNGQTFRSVNDSESLGTLQVSGTLTVRVVDREPAKTACAFRGVELVSDALTGGTAVRGIEAVRMNEVMIEPTTTLDIGTALFESLGSDWVCAAGAESCVNSGVGQARWTWTSLSLRPGRYHVRVFGLSSGQTVGEVRIDGDSALLMHGGRHGQTLLVGADGKVTLTIGKTRADQTYYMKAVNLSLEPDAEYVELINLSDEAIDVGGWTIEGGLTGGVQGRLPQGARIAPHGYLVAAVDLEDRDAEPSALASNGIDARTAWEIQDTAPAVQLEFPNGAPSPDSDWLKAAVPEGEPLQLLLKRAQVIVDAVQYLRPFPTTTPFQSLEKGDPTVLMDANLDGIDDGWYPSLRLYTPGATNDNEGLAEDTAIGTRVHDPATELTFPNRALQGIGEVAGMPSGRPWKPYASADLAKFVDRLTVDGHRLETEGRAAGGTGQAAWEEKDDYDVHVDPRQAEAVGAWRWTEVPDGIYRMSLLACEECSGEQLTVRWGLADGAMSAWSPTLTSDAQGRVTIGQVTIGLGGTPSQTLLLEVRCMSLGGICHLDAVRLDPQLVHVGAINVNTASLDVLRLLPGMTDALLSRLIAGRPYGDQGDKGRGIGDLLAGEVLGATEEDKLDTFRRLAHLLTTRSDVFSITSLGQAMTQRRVDATQRITAVVER